MAYTIHNFKSGEVLTAESLNQMDNQILELTNRKIFTDSDSTQIQTNKEDLSTLSKKMDELEKKVDKNPISPDEDNQCNCDLSNLLTLEDVQSEIRKTIELDKGVIYAIVDGEKTKLLTINDLKNAMLTGTSTTTTPSEDAPDDQIVNVGYVKNAITSAQLGGDSSGVTEESIKQIVRNELSKELSNTYNYNGIYNIK